MTSLPNTVDEAAATRLQQLGYRQQLRRAVSLKGNFALTLSDISPTTSLLVVGTAVIATAGTGSIWAYLIGGVIAMCVAACMGELGSMFPVAGGVFTTVHKVLGRPTGFVALLMYVGQATIVPAAVAVGIGTYVSTLVSGVNTNILAGCVAIVATLVALLNVDFSAKLIGFFLILEMAVIGILFAAGITHLHQPLSILASHGIAAHGSGFGPVATSAVVAALVVALQSANGFDSALNWSEETDGPSKTVGRSVVTCAATGVVTQVIPFVLILFAAGNLRTLIRSSTPLTAVVGQAFGHSWVTIITIGAVIAIFNSVVVLILQFSRILYASGRDGFWPPLVNRALASVEPRRDSPWVAVVLIGVVATTLSFQASLVATITLGAIFVTGLYVLVGIAALVSRYTQRDMARPSRMWFWPLPPAIAIIGGGLGIEQQSEHDLLIVGGIVLGGLIYYALYLRGRGTAWAPSDATAGQRVTMPDTPLFDPELS